MVKAAPLSQPSADFIRLLSHVRKFLYLPTASLLGRNGRPKSSRIGIVPLHSTNPTATHEVHHVKPSQCQQSRQREESGRLSVITPVPLRFWLPLCSSRHLHCTVIITSSFVIRERVSFIPQSSITATHSLGYFVARFVVSRNVTLRIPTVSAPSTSCIPRPTGFSAAHIRRSSIDRQHTEALTVWLSFTERREEWAM